MHHRWHHRERSGSGPPHAFVPSDRDVPISSGYQFGQALNAVSYTRLHDGCHSQTLFPFPRPLHQASGALLRLPCAPSPQYQFASLRVRFPSCSLEGSSSSEPVEVPATNHKENDVMKLRTKRTIASLVMAAAFATLTLAPTVTLAASSASQSSAAKNTNKSRSKKPVNANAKAKANEAPAGATAECRDGTYSYSAHRRGTCSHHGGVKRWLR